MLRALKGLSAIMLTLKTRMLCSFFKEIHKSTIGVASGHLKRLRIDVFKPRVFFFKLNQLNNEIITAQRFASFLIAIVRRSEIAVIDPTDTAKVVNQGLTLGVTWIDPILI